MQVSGGSAETAPVLGILTGISYVSGIDYYKGINEKFASLVKSRHIMTPNPPIIMASVDCDKYAAMLVVRTRVRRGRCRCPEYHVVTAFL